ncbi:MAG: hypothetical protein HY527_23795 [Betaproteobacteria bacterium]|nr:hypothetical protein [Betaproteobacteria bacterium]
MRHPRDWRATCAAVGLFLAANVSSAETTGADALAVRVDAILARRGLGPDALLVIDNIVRHEAPPPLAAPPIVRELLAHPLAATGAATLFKRAVPAALRRLANDVPAEPPRLPMPERAPLALADLLAVYLDELAAAQRLLREAVHGGQIDAPAIIVQLERGPPSPDQLRRIAGAVDAATLDRATLIFLDATARFVDALRAARPNLRFPETMMRFDSAVGIVSIGTRGDDVHGPDAAVIIDPGGNDIYERTPVTAGRISVIVDLGGDDHYRGSDLTVHGLSAIIDFSGNDRYMTSGPGWGAAIAGASVLVDFSGDDAYEAGMVGQGAAAFGLGAIVDLRGNDTYRLRSGGQGFGMAGGLGLLWDRNGNDSYRAAGLADVFGRGGGVSHAQGAAFGFRTMIGGGVGILRDDAGDDLYEAQMFAQGMGFYYGVGLLWDRGGDDRYHAVRYAQGNGVHEAVGVLRDESGNDHYELTVGVGQGMGLDLAVGILLDGAGDDRYRAPVLAQGTATANGVGIVIDTGGADRWYIDADQPSWGRAHWSRGLPSLGLLLYESSRAVFTRKGEAVSQPPLSAEFGGPLGGAPITHEPPQKPACPEVALMADHPTLPFAEALNRITPGFGGGTADPAAYAEVHQRVTTQLQASIAELPRDSFNVTWALGEALRCTLVAAAPDDAAAMWRALEQLVVEEPATPFAGAFTYALRARPAPASQMERILRALDEHPQCGVRAAALTLRYPAADDESSRAVRAQAALRSSCWRLQATARARLKRLGVAPDAGAVLPSFLRGE